MAVVRPELLEILACPVPRCHGALVQRGDRLVCVSCGLRYRIEQSWPVLIPEEADPPEPDNPRVAADSSMPDAAGPPASGAAG